jgi:uncharacterized protein YkwD
MRRSERIAALVALLLLLYPVAQSAASPQLEMVGRINDIRRSHGLPALDVSRSLMRSADAYSETMMERQYFGHANRIQASSRFRRLGEIIEIHRGGRPDVEWAIRDWLGSPPHMRVILDDLFTYIGAGYTVGRFGSYTSTIWVVHFGRP